MFIVFTKKIDDVISILYIESGILYESYTMGKKTSDEVINDIRAMKKIVNEYLSTISESIKPKGLEDIVTP
jgi:hypothetical protein